MTIYVDPPMPPPCLDRLEPGWPSLTTNGPVEELHEFARSIGVGRGWFSDGPAPSYALTPEARERAVRAGARTVRRAAVPRPRSGQAHEEPAPR